MKTETLLKRLRACKNLSDINVLADKVEHEYLAENSVKDGSRYAKSAIRQYQRQCLKRFNEALHYSKKIGNHYITTDGFSLLETYDPILPECPDAIRYPDITRCYPDIGAEIEIIPTIEQCKAARTLGKNAVMQLVDKNGEKIFINPDYLRVALSIYPVGKLYSALAVNAGRVSYMPITVEYENGLRSLVLPVRPDSGMPIYRL